MEVTSEKEVIEKLSNANICVFCDTKPIPKLLGACTIHISRICNIIMKLL